MELARNTCSLVRDAQTMKSGNGKTLRVGHTPPVHPASSAPWWTACHDPDSLGQEYDDGNTLHSTNLS
jgi:hypothetical protein